MLSCPRGAASPAAHTQRRLFAASAGYCQNPGCQCALFVDLPGKAIHIAEMAHVFAAQDHGPRASAKLTKTQRGAFENLVLLCANCHTMVDKAPDQFCDATMLGWKRDHAVKLQALFGVTKYSDRIAARAAIEPLLRENHTIFDQYGPHIAAAVNPESGAQDLWGERCSSGSFRTIGASWLCSMPISIFCGGRKRPRSKYFDNMSTISKRGILKAIMKTERAFPPRWPAY